MRLNGSSWLRVSPSLIPHPDAGLGVFATRPLVPGHWDRYVGTVRNCVGKLLMGGTRSWVIRPYHPETGKPQNEDTLGYLDGATHNHWTRYVNGSDSAETANVEQVQIYDQIYYRVIKAIHPGEELLVYYDFNFNNDGDSDSDN